MKVEEHMMIKETTIDGVRKYHRLVYKDRPFISVLRGCEDCIIQEADTIEELCDEFRREHSTEETPSLLTHPKLAVVEKDNDESRQN